jgi:phage recombination protein Bet
MKTTTNAIKPKSQRNNHLTINRKLGIPTSTPETISQAIRDSGLSYDAYVRAITATALSDLITWTQADLERLILVAKQHGLNPLNREIFMLSNNTDSAPLIAVGVDGWAKIMNSHPKFAGMVFSQSEELRDGIPAWIECEIHRHDRVVPLKVREYFEESRSDQLAWITHPRRMLRHKCMVQCARLAFGLPGIYDADEASRIKESKRLSRSVPSPLNAQKNKGIEALRESVEMISGNSITNG